MSDGTPEPKQLRGPDFSPAEEAAASKRFINEIMSIPPKQGASDLNASQKPGDLRGTIGRSDSRPDGVHREIDKMARSDKSMLDRLETSFLSGDMKSLSRLLESVAPSREANLADRASFAQAFKTFRSGIADLGYDAKYDSSTGVMQIDKLKLGPNSNVTRVTFDPERHAISITKSDPKSLHNVTIDTSSGLGTDSVIQTNPFKQFQEKISEEAILRDYGEILKDALKANADDLERRQKEEQVKQEEDRLALEAEEERQAGIQQRISAQTRDLELLMEQQRKAMQPRISPAPTSR